MGRQLLKKVIEKIWIDGFHGLGGLAQRNRLVFTRLMS
jgi:hypothetical protein